MVWALPIDSFALQLDEFSASDYLARNKRRNREIVTISMGRAKRARRSSAAMRHVLLGNN